MSNTNVEFDHLLEKIQQLVQLVETLRVENMQLRCHVAEVASQNAVLTARMSESHQRISTLLAHISYPEQLEEEKELV